MISTWQFWLLMAFLAAWLAFWYGVIQWLSKRSKEKAVIDRNTEVIDSQPTELGWLIEKDQMCLGGSAEGPAWVAFTDVRAIRFSRQIDAEMMLLSLQLFSSNGLIAFVECHVEEHSWG